MEKRNQLVSLRDEKRILEDKISDMLTIFANKYGVIINDADIEKSISVTQNYSILLDIRV